ncbi:tetratricopeptide repeat protein [Bosea caraganae]|uniref:tetratricopeptide repeat protein n=1 Tax=Bosea caraganae TaxID=2763117 RepID=UPI001FE93E82|nr:tetratricopeptide repeat protein [Bosea caraganae]
METPVELQRPCPAGRAPALELRLLGPLVLSRGGTPVALPASRKVRALLAYLALASQPVPRSQLCDLFWDVPDDPRGELRWCLSKLRILLDEPGRQRVLTRGDAIGLDLSDCGVDAIAVAKAGREGFVALAPERLEALAALFASEFLEGLELERCPVFAGWLTAQRRRFRGCHVALLEHLARRTESDGSGYLEQWLELAPFDLGAHDLLLREFARRGQIREGDQHLAAAARLFQSEELDCAPLRAAWSRARAEREAPCERCTISVGPEARPGQPDAPSASRRASIAVMPFLEQGAAGDGGGLGDMLAHDVITRLAKLRSLFIIAQGTVFTLHDRRIGAEQAGRLLNVDYVVGGSVRRSGKRLTVAVELSETRNARILWADTLDHTLDDAFLVLDEIGNRIVASAASEIETSERNRAILKPPNSLDAWEAHHRGLWHMYRFTPADNAQARHFFERAVRLDPTFARAHAGLSFTHFQSAFQGWEPREQQADRAFEAAGQSLLVDDRDPAAHWAMGRALWLRNQHDQSIAELEQAIGLSPNFAQGHYALAFVHSQGGDASIAVSSADHSRQLSPFDPMLFAMFGARAMALARLGRFAEAAEWSLRAAARPNAHAQIMAIAAYCLALAGRLNEARDYLAAIHRSLPQYGIEDFLTAMRFTPDGERLFRESARRVGGA